MFFLKITYIGRKHNLDKFVCTAHGTSIALISYDDKELLACTDYEYKFDKLFNNYKKIAPKFSESFSPFLENGLNIGQQIYYLYKRKQKLGYIERSQFGDFDMVVKAPYEAQENDCILHQIAAKNQGDGSGKRVFERFMQFNKGRDIVLSVRAANDRAIGFYKKYGFIKVSDITWGKDNQVKGEVYLLEQKPLFRYRENNFEEIISY